MSKKSIVHFLTCTSLIGVPTTIVESTNPLQINITGTIIEDCANSLLLKTSKGNKRLIKNTVTLKLAYNGKEYAVNGHALKGTLAHRIKKMR